MSPESRIAALEEDLRLTQAALLDLLGRVQRLEEDSAALRALALRGKERELMLALMPMGGGR